MVASNADGIWDYSALSSNIALEVGQNGDGNLGTIKLNSYDSGHFVFLRPSNGNYHVDSTRGYYYFNWDADVHGGKPGVVNIGNASSAAAISLHTAGNSFFNGGNVGIGTTNPSKAKLQVESSGYPIYAQSTQRYIQAWNRPSHGYWWLALENNKLIFHENGDGDHFAIDTNGNVGIGKSATVSSSYNTYGAMNPQAPLHIYKESKGAPQDKRVEAMRLETNQYDFEGGNGGTILTMVAGNENATPAKGEIGLLNDYVSNSESDGQFQFKLRDRSGNMKEVMTMRSNGQVIGAAQHVNGTQLRICVGVTNDSWTYYSSNAVYKDIDISGCGFTSTPVITTSLAGTSSHWTVTGMTSIYSPTKNGFRIYLNGATTSSASGYDYQVHWSAYGI